jgi:ABC-2 type transport system permease protein
MNTQSGVTSSNPVSGSFGSQGIAAAALSAMRPMYWSVRRELWENRSIYIAPLVAATVFLLGFLVSLIGLPGKMRGLSALDPAKQHAAIEMPYDTVAALIMGIAMIVGVFYCLDALYGERRDRSILFWKSLPVSDLTTVLSKLVIPIVILPLLSFVITVATQFIMLLLSSVVLLGSGLGAGTLWAQSSFFHVSLGLLSHLVIIHGLWYAPFYGWLLLVSAGAPRAPFVWAFLPPFMICAVEKMAFNTSYFAAILLYRATGPETYTPTPGSTMMDMIPALPPMHFFTTPGLWNGLALAVGFLAAAIWLRRYRGPI